MAKLTWITTVIGVSTIALGMAGPAFALGDATAGASAAVRAPDSEASLDYRADRLNRFLIQYKSPLAAEAESFIEIADKYQLNWMLLPAISGVESTFGRNMPTNSYNPFGWGIYGNLVLRFKSFPEAIEAVAKGLTERYPQGAVNDIYRLGRIYNGVTPGSWSGKVQFFINRLESQPFGTSALEPTI